MGPSCSSKGGTAKRCADLNSHPGCSKSWLMHILGRPQQSHVCTQYFWRMESIKCVIVLRCWCHKVCSWHLTLAGSITWVAMSFKDGRIHCVRGDVLYFAGWIHFVRGDFLWCWQDPLHWCSCLLAQTGFNTYDTIFFMIFRTGTDNSKHEAARVINNCAAYSAAAAELIASSNGMLDALKVGAIMGSVSLRTPVRRVFMDFNQRYHSSFSLLRIWGNHGNFRFWLLVTCWFAMHVYRCA